MFKFSTISFLNRPVDVWSKSIALDFLPTLEPQYFVSFLYIIWWYTNFGFWFSISERKHYRRFQPKITFTNFWNEEFYGFSCIINNFKYLLILASFQWKCSKLNIMVEVSEVAWFTFEGKITRYRPFKSKKRYFTNFHANLKIVFFRKFFILHFYSPYIFFIISTILTQVQSC